MPSHTRTLCCDSQFTRFCFFHTYIGLPVPTILKQLRYPFEKSITKSQIAAVGGNNWGTFLGMLHWIMQLARMGAQYDSGAYDESCLEGGIDVSSDRIVFDFLTKFYHSWLAMDDDTDDDAVNEVLKPHVDEMATKFDGANSKYLEQAKMLKTEHKPLQDQIDELNKIRPQIAKLEEQIKTLGKDKGKFESWNTNMEAKVEKYQHRAKPLQDQIDELNKTGPRIAKLEEQIKTLGKDKGKFESWNTNMEAKVEKYQHRAKLLEMGIEKCEHELHEAEGEKVELQAAVDQQGMKVEDIDRLNAERERLQKAVETTSQRLDEAKRRATEREADATQRLDGLERTVQEFNALGFQVGIIPGTAANAKGQDFSRSHRQVVSSTQRHFQCIYIV